MELGEKDDGGARLCGECVGHSFYSLCMEVPMEDFKQDRGTIQCVFLKRQIYSYTNFTTRLCKK